jgi:uncharacterized protein (TIGR02217 family)
MSVIETRLSAKVEAGLSVVPMRYTNVVQLRSGVEYRNANWSKARRRFTARFAKLPSDARDELLHLWHCAEGMTYGFLLRDYSDYTATDESQGVAPSGTTAIQLRKTYSFGSGGTARTHVRNITRPEASTLTVYQDNGSGVFVAKDGTVDATTGLFTPTTSWTAGRALRATFWFLVPVRFASDEPEWLLPFRDIAEISVEFIEVIGE